MRIFNRRNKALLKRVELLEEELGYVHTQDSEGYHQLIPAQYGDIVKLKNVTKGMKAKD